MIPYSCRYCSISGDLELFTQKKCQNYLLGIFHIVLWTVGGQPPAQGGQRPHGGEDLQRPLSSEVWYPSGGGDVWSAVRRILQ